MTPCLVVRVDFLAAEAMPCLRRTTSASPRSPLVSTSAFLHCIIPAPVRSRSGFTSCALISITSLPLANARGSERLILSRDRQGAVVVLAVSGRNLFGGLRTGPFARQRNRRQ